MFVSNLSLGAASALDRSSKSVCSVLLSWTCDNRNCRIKGKLQLWNCCDLYHSHVLPTKEELRSHSIQISKSQTGCDSTYQICSSLLSLQGFETGGSQAQLPPGAQRDAILLPWSLRIPCRSLTCHTARSKQYGHGAAKQSTGRKCQPAAIWNPMCLLQLCSFFVGDFGLQFIVWDQTLQQQWTSPVIYSHDLLGARACSKSDRACVLDLSSKSLWSSLVSCEDVTQARNQSMAPSST